MAETSVTEFEKLAELFDGTEYADYLASVMERKQQAMALVASLQV